MDARTKSFYVFEDFTLDVPRKSLWRAGSLVSLTPKAIDTLLVLIKYRGLVVDKDTLLNEVWAETFVEEATLAQNISTLRRVLGTTPDKNFIETIPRRGYRFVTEVKEISSVGERIIQFENSSDLGLSGVSEMENLDPGQPVTLVDINMSFQAVISNNGKYLISVRRQGDDWILQMRPI
jgi:DNA-binding winged helix-turn-helix (wHTH) protein